MNIKAELESLEVSLNDLSANGREKLRELAEVGRVLKINPEDPCLEQAIIENIVAENDLRGRVLKETECLDTLQGVLKDSLILLSGFEQILPVLKYENNNEGFKSIEKEIEELQKEVDGFSNRDYEKSIDHRRLVELSEEIDAVIKEVDRLQEKNEIYGNFPDNPFKAHQVVDEAESELARLEEEWSNRVNEMFS